MPNSTKNQKVQNQWLGRRRQTSHSPKMPGQLNHYRPFEIPVQLPPIFLQLQLNPTHKMLLLPKTTTNHIRIALKLSAKTGFLQGGKQVHAHLIKSGFYNALALQNQILSGYVKCKELSYARHLFDEMTVRNIVTWNILICGFVDSGCHYKSNPYLGFSYFKRMLFDEIGFDAITFNGLFRACIEINELQIGRQLHGFVVKLGFELACLVASALVHLYGKCGLPMEARNVFDSVLVKDLVLWNVMMSCYVFNSVAEEAFRVFKLMQQENLIGDCFTFSSLFKSCATLGSSELGRQIHGLICKVSFDLDILVASALVDMYAKSKNIEEARKAFDGMTAKNVVTWNTIVVAYGQLRDGKEGMRLLKKMLLDDFAPDELTLASILSSCGNASAGCEVIQVHDYVLKCGFQSFVSIGNAMINAYSKCGKISCALETFNSISEPNLITWTSVISGYAFNGLHVDSIKMFEKMLSAGVRPDRISFLVVLSACSHGGLIEEGIHYFSLMTKHYCILPDSEHYACLIDLLGRAGHLNEAFKVLTSMPIDHRSDTLAAFVGACKVHGNVGLASWAAEKLLELEPNNPINYAIMSNVYAYEGQWHDVARMRKLMRDRCDHKVPGCSWVEFGGATHMFTSSDKRHSRASEVYCILRTLLWQMSNKNNFSVTG